MGRTDSTVSDEKPPPPQPLDPETRSPEDVAREIGAAGRSGPADPPVDDDALHQGGRLRFDKSGALAGRPKLKPVRAHRKEGEEEAEREAAAERAERDSKPRKASLPPRIGALRPEGFTPAAAAPQEEDDEVAIEGGTFLYGDARKAREVPAFRIDRYPVTNEAYARFVAATGHRAPLYWNAGQPLPDLADHPVVGVDYYDALAYAQWRGKDLPFEDEWERAARGNDGRVYPWGNDQELSGANTARVGLKMTVPIDLHPENVSPDGVRDMVGNVWEITHSPASGGGVVVRGGSWYDFALYAKTFFRFASRADARNGTIGFRCVRRDAERDPAVDRGATREIPPEQAAAEIAARRGEQPPVDVTTWSVEKRDLLPDLNRLRNYVAEARAEILLGAKVADKHPAPPPAIAFTPPPPPSEPEPEPTPPPRREPEPEPEPLPPEVIAAAGHVTGAAEPEVLVTEVEDEESAPAEFEAAPAAAPERVHVLDTRAAPPPPPRRFKQPARRPERAPVGRLPAARSMPTWMWGLLALGFLLFGGLIVMLVERGGNEQLTEPQFADDEEVAAPTVPDRLAGLPEPLPYEEFPGANEPPRIIDAAVESDAATLYSGLWLVLFANPATLEGAQTLQAAHELHRRVAPEGVRVAVVLPRRPYERSGGELPGMDDLRVALETDGGRWVGDAMHVVLDPEGEDDRGVLHARHANAAVPVTAVLLRDGAVERRTTPPEGGFSLVTLVGIAKRALQIARNP
jgi:formylglycine-generating enzyme required for sulfatase activity